MDDLIRRQDAIDAIADYLSKTTYTSSISHLNTGALILARVPSIDAVPQWVLCSERLPEEGIKVVTVDKDGEYEINHIIDEEDGEWFWEKPVAWIPLPKLYKAERKES